MLSGTLSGITSIDTILFVLIGIALLAFLVVIIALAVYVGGVKNYYMTMYLVAGMAFVCYAFLAENFVSRLVAWIYVILFTMASILVYGAVINGVKSRRIR
jgi:hypothetical protein